MIQRDPDVDDVEPDRLLGDGRAEVSERQPAQAILFAVAHGVGSGTEAIAAAGLDLHEDEHAVMPHQQVDLAQLGADVSCYDFVPARGQVQRSQVFARSAKSLTRIGTPA